MPDRLCDKRRANTARTMGMQPSHRNTITPIRRERVPVSAIIPVILLALLFLDGTTVSAQHPTFPLFRPPTTFSPQHSSQSTADLAKGKFLVAAKSLLDANFSETVVLLIDYNEDGAMGVVINRPTEVQLSAVLPEMKELEKRTDFVYIGGPVDRSQLLLLVRTQHNLEGSLPVFGDVYASIRRSVLRKMMDTPETKAQFRAYAGYAGWGPGQLDNEVSRGDWYILPADTETIFEKAPDAIWPELIRRGTVEWVHHRPQSNRRELGDYWSPLSGYPKNSLKMCPKAKILPPSASRLSAPPSTSSGQALPKGAAKA
jgi:putative transcriptional regulator